MRSVSAPLARILLPIAVMALLLPWLAACTPQYIREDRTDRREKELRIKQHAGGTHHATVVENGRWFQTFGNELLVIDTTNGRELGRADGVKFGEGGSLVDMIAVGDTAWAVSANTALVKFDVADNSSPRVTDTIPAAKLGIEPLFVSQVGEEIYVTGKGGVLRVRDRHRYLKDMTPTHVVGSKVGPVACVGRKILAIEDGRYLGAATALVQLPAGLGPQDGYAFLLQGQNGASVGIMSPAFTELDQSAIPARVRRIRICGDRLFAITDKTLFAWRIDGNTLVEPEEIALKGGRDIALIKPNHYAVAGTFGRSMYRHKAEDRRAPDTFYNVERQPGLLEVSMTDSRRILAGGREGFWLWRIGATPQLTEKTTDLTTMVGTDRTLAWGTARLVQEKGADGVEVGVAVELSHDGIQERYQPLGAPRIHVIEAIDGDLWIGHDRGVDILHRAEFVKPTSEDKDGDGKVDPDPDAPKPAASAEPEPRVISATDLAGAPVAPAKPGAPAKPVPDSVQPAMTARIVALREWRFEGPVLFMYPERIGGGAAMISLHGGFILAKPEAVGDAPTFKGRGSVK